MTATDGEAKTRFGPTRLASPSARPFYPAAAVRPRMSEREDPMEFDEVREQAAAAVRDSDAESVYVGLVGDSVDDEYYFANDVDEEELQEMATRQLGMLARVLSEQSGASIDQVAKHAAETAKKMNLR